VKISWILEKERYFKNSWNNSDWKEIPWLVGRYSWVQLGEPRVSVYRLGMLNKGSTCMALKRAFELKGNLHEPGSLSLYLIKYDKWGRFLRTMFTRTTSHFPPHFFHCRRVPQRQEFISLLPWEFFSACSSLCDRKRSEMENGSIGNENLQTIYRWKALSEENILEWFISSFMCCTSLAFKGKEIGCEVQLGDLGNNQINWRFREIHVGPTMRLR
jgi:hypothetical protein